MVGVLSMEADHKCLMAGLFYQASGARAHAVLSPSDEAEVSVYLGACAKEGAGKGKPHLILLASS